MTNQEMKQKARALRADVIRMIYLSQSGHTGSSLSAMDLLVALYYGKMRIDPKNPDWEDRDRFVLSKAHANPALYAVLSDLGFFPREELWTLRKLHTNLQGHPNSWDDARWNEFEQIIGRLKADGVQFINLSEYIANLAGNCR